METIENTWTKVKFQGRKAFIPYIVAGYPEPALCAELIRLLAREGDILEIGVPFSDPIADGPTIQEAGQIALSHGMSLRTIMRFLDEVRLPTNTPVVLMSYFNPIYRYGIRSFAEDLLGVGVSGVIIPDLPPEEAGAWVSEARDKEIATIFLVAPTSTEERIRQVGTVSRGFVYYVSTTGITGNKVGELGEIKGQVNKIREITRLPVAVGFGISSPSEAKSIASVSDGVVVGSALIRTIKRAFAEGGRGMEEVSDFLTSLRNAMS